MSSEVPLDRVKLLAARFRASSDRPYLASALYSLTVVPTTAIQTMGVDQHWRCYVSPAFVEQTSVTELVGVWIHEVAHLLRDHHGRADRLTVRDHHRVNLAQDCEINDDLLADGLSLPAGRIEPATFGLPTGKLFEEYVLSIPPTPDAPNCGSGAHGQPAPWESTGPGVGAVEAATIRRQTAQSVRASVRARGRVPAGWRRWADGVLEPVVDWRRALTGAVREATAGRPESVDYTTAAIPAGCRA
ncbi:vWA domain-containing protein, partial [Fodinicola feengrottensis]